MLVYICLHLVVCEIQVSCWIQVSYLASPPIVDPILRQAFEELHINVYKYENDFYDKEQ